MSVNQTNSWNVSEFVDAWKSKDDGRNQLMGDATRLMLQHANVKEGSKVLDVAVGTGDQTFMAAELVGPSGSVIATDISDKMLEAAAALANEKGFTNISTQVMDAQALHIPENSFDSVISRHGLMFVPNPRIAFEEIYRVLKKDGKVGALVWSTPDKNPAFVIPMQVLQDYVKKSDSSSMGSGIFSLGDSKKTIIRISWI